MALKEFMVMKNKMLRYYGAPFDLTDGEDLRELETWPDDVINHATTSIKSAVYDSDNIYVGPDRFCPWCLTSVNCYMCSYGERHGICDKKGSRYNRVVRKKGLKIREIIYKHRNHFLSALEK